MSVIFVTVRHGVGRHAEIAPEISDRMIDSVASGLRKGLRVGDLLGVYNANELAILLSQTDAATASLVAERTRIALSTHLSSIHRESWPVSVWLGVASDGTCRWRIRKRSGRNGAWPRKRLNLWLAPSFCSLIRGDANTH